MARLYTFIITDSRKTLEDFLTQSQNGLSQSVHKGYLAVTRKGSFYFMNFFTTHPMKLKIASKVIAYCEYPDNKLDKIFYQVIEGQFVSKERKTELSR